MSVVEVGVGKSRIASRYFGSGSIVELDNLKPAKSTVRWANWNFSGFNTMSDLPSSIK